MVPDGFDVPKSLTATLIILHASCRIYNGEEEGKGMRSLQWVDVWYDDAM
jgi:hypothetical protein